MPSWQSYSYLWGPVMVCALLVVIVFFMRWAFAGGNSLVRPTAGRPGRPEEYGLLVDVAQPRTYEEGSALRRRLEEQGIATTLTRTTEGLRVMVWPADAARARDLLRR